MHRGNITHTTFESSLGKQTYAISGLLIEKLFLSSLFTTFVARHCEKHRKVSLTKNNICSILVCTRCSISDIYYNPLNAKLPPHCYDCSYKILDLQLLISYGELGAKADVEEYRIYTSAWLRFCFYYTVLLIQIYIRVLMVVEKEVRRQPTSRKITLFAPSRCKVNVLVFTQYTSIRFLLSPCSCLSDLNIEGSSLARQKCKCFEHDM